MSQRGDPSDLDPVRAVELDPDPVPPAPPPRVKPLAPQRYELRVTIGQATRDKLERAKALMRHQNPSGDIAEVLDRALDALLEKIEKRKFGATSRPRATKARGEDADPAYVPAEVRRRVHERDDEQCTFVSAEGVRCTERAFLELDHRTPRCRGGKPTVEETRLMCRAHNQYAADQELGRDFMQAKRAAAKAAKLARQEANATRDQRIAARGHGGGGKDEVTAEPVDRGVPRAGAEAARAERDAPPADDAATQIENDVTRALRGLGFKADETSRAVASTAGQPAATLEERVRAALIAATRARGNRCAEADDAVPGWRTDHIEWNFAHRGGNGRADGSVRIEWA